MFLLTAIDKPLMIIFLMSDDVFALLDLSRGSMLDANRLRRSSERARSTSMKNRVHTVLPLTCVCVCVWNEI